MIQEEAFRDSIGTISEDGSRNFIYPKKTKGRFTIYRQIVAYALVALLFIMPWIRINGLPLVQVDVLHRRFILLGQIFWPQDFHLLFLGMLVLILGISLFTVAYGRLFCGWVCPQTIFMEHVFRRIEYWIEGDRNHQIRLSQAPWTLDKIWKRVAKNGLFLAISFVISNTFLMYIIGTGEWLNIVSHGPQAHLSGFIGIWIFTGVFYFVFAWFREQVCLIVCPYGRLQGVLLDKNSLVIAYDRIRGEIRSRFRKSEDRTALGQGYCIDCDLCVQVCPTGIDIRNGTQLECINCTACIDACDTVMDGMNKPRGLIRFASENEIAEGKSFMLTARMKAYGVIVMALVAIWLSLLLFRSPIEATILRAPGQMMQDRGESISNLYTFKVINKGNELADLSFSMIAPKGASLQHVGTDKWVIEPLKLAQGSMFVILPKTALNGAETKVTIGVFLNGKLVDDIGIRFYGVR